MDFPICRVLFYRIANLLGRTLGANTDFFSILKFVKYNNYKLTLVIFFRIYFSSLLYYNMENGPISAVCKVEGSKPIVNLKITSLKL